MGFDNPLVGGTALRLPAIQSPNYVAGSTGWIIKIDGSAEFNNLTVRGQFQGTDFIINSSGIFLYSGTPANGNLVGSWAPASGTDAYGNTFPQGLSIGANTTRQIVLNYNGSTASVTFRANNGHANSSSRVLEAIVNATLANEYLSIQLQGPSVTTYTHAVNLLLSSQNEDGTSDANFVFNHSTAGNLATLDPTGMTLAVPVTASNLAVGTAQTPAPGAGGGTSTVAVSFGKTFASAPSVVISPRTTVDPATVTITGYVDSITTTGCTIRAYRSTNSATNWSWWAAV